ncbi:hypothetical protein N0824_01139 [Microcystis sp. 0824]|nr:hypothetical protein N0824_01139 [Microcystis sp. 0824]
MWDVGCGEVGCGVWGSGEVGKFQLKPQNPKTPKPNPDH